MIVLGLAGVAATLVAWKFQGSERSLIHGFAVAAVITMFWSYRRHYDTILMALLLAPLLAVARRGDQRTTALALLVGATLWLPVRHGQWDWMSVKVIDLVLWIAAGVVLVVWDRPRQEPLTGLPPA